MKNQKGFTLIELMVVIVIIGILSALALPKMFGVSAKAKVAEAPGVIANYETLQYAYLAETSVLGTATQIGFSVPASNWWTYSDAVTGIVEAEAVGAMGTCAAGNLLQSSVPVDGSDATRRGTQGCLDYLPNFKGTPL